MDVGSKKRVLISRLKKKVKRQRNVIQALTLWIQMNDSWEKRDDSQYEINELLKNKNSLLQQRIKQLESELDAVRRYSEAKAQ